VICTSTLRRIVGPIGGAWIPYTAAQVAARRAAQTVVIMTCVSAAPPSAHAPGMPVALPPVWPSIELVPAAVPHVVPVDVSEPGGLALLGVGLVALWWVRR
jgi:hypothetical protein